MSIIDISGIAIALTSIGVTLASVYVAFLLTNNYIEFVSEFKNIKNDYNDVTNAISNNIRNNKAILDESVIISEVLFDLIMYQNTLKRHLDDFFILSTKSEWRGVFVDSDSATIYAERLNREIMYFESICNARAAEMYWLVSSDLEKQPYLNSLVHTKGDVHTIVLIERILSVRNDISSDSEQKELSIAAALLRNRLRRPPPSAVKTYDSSSWTGR